jgi:hypothetical protein
MANEPRDVARTRPLWDLERAVVRARPAGDGGEWELDDAAWEAYRRVAARVRPHVFADEAADAVDPQRLYGHHPQWAAFGATRNDVHRLGWTAWCVDKPMLVAEWDATLARTGSAEAAMVAVDELACKLAPATVRRLRGELFGRAIAAARESTTRHREAAVVRVAAPRTSVAPRISARAERRGRSPQRRRVVRRARSPGRSSDDPDPAELGARRLVPASGVAA